jgi:hypothetical protein
MNRQFLKEINEFLDEEIERTLSSFAYEYAESRATVEKPILGVCKRKVEMLGFLKYYINDYSDIKECRLDGFKSFIPPKMGTYLAPLKQDGG